MFKPYFLLCIVVAMSLSGATFAAPVELENQSLSVTVDSEFPRIIQYRSEPLGTVLNGQLTPVSAVKLNGETMPCKVAFDKSGADSATYRLSFPSSQMEVTMQLSLSTNGVDWRVTEVRERGAQKLKTLAFPHNALLPLNGRQTNAAVAMMQATGYNFYGEWIGLLATMAPHSGPVNYFFLSTGDVAAGITDNALDDSARVDVRTTFANGVITCTAQNPVWQYREVDGETLELPWVKVLVTGDRNGDGKADWQDAALAYREETPRPFGAEYVRETVADQIAMDFASGAQQPFLRILDNVKKVNLLTDGLGQEVLIKGYTAEGHDSANTDYGGHYNERAGGLKDLNFMLDRFHQYHARGGVHINVTEVYPEAHRYHPEILARDAAGNLKPGWCWLDHSSLIDKRKDLLDGDILASLDRMRQEMPRLDYVFVDVYGENGWTAWKLASKLNSLGLALGSEYATVFDPACTWAHQPGFQSRISRFIWNGDRDIFRDQDTLLRGADHLGFMGWHDEHDINAFVRSTFGQNLPSKFLQHFPLLRWDNNSAVFADGVKVVKTGNTVTCTQNGRLVMTWAGNCSQNRLFIPWNPITQEKIYVWDEVGTAQTWELPPAWTNRTEIFQYRLTDLGRTNELKLPVTDGHVTIAVAKNTPYVIYPTRAPAQPPMTWGEGSLVKDPGFDSHGFDSWTPIPAGASHMHIENDRLGNARLLIRGAGGAAGEVSQTITGLEGGKTYAASVWVQIKGRRLASLIIQPQAEGALAVSNYVTHTLVRHSAPNDPRTGTYYERMKVLFDMPAGCSTTKLTLSVDKGAPETAVEFDDVRIVPTQRSPEAARHWFYEDFEHVDMGYGPFTCCPNEYTHLSEANPPYTDDTIHGRYSLKSREKNGMVLRTLPVTLRFMPNMHYRLTCETIGEGHFTFFSAGQKTDLKFPAGKGQITGEFVTGNDTDSYLGLFKDGGDSIVIDDLAIDELGAAPASAGATTAASHDKPITDTGVPSH